MNDAGVFLNPFFADNNLLVFNSDLPAHTAGSGIISALAGDDVYSLETGLSASQTLADAMGVNILRFDEKYTPVSGTDADTFSISDWTETAGAKAGSVQSVALTLTDTSPNPDTSHTITILAPTGDNWFYQFGDTGELLTYDEFTALLPELI